MFESFSQTIWLVPLYAFAGALLALPWSPGIIRQTGPRPAGYLNLIMTFLAFFHGLFHVLDVLVFHAETHMTEKWQHYDRRRPLF
mgnify:CR=1 FL=1